MDDQFLAFAPKFAVSEIAFNWVKFPYKPFNIFPSRSDRQKHGRRFNKKPRAFSKAANGSLWMQCNWICREVMIDRGNHRFLVIRGGQIPSNSGKPELVKHRRNILMFELNRPFAPIDFASQKAIVRSLIKRNASHFIAQH
jgi:hypothetical protein